MMAIELQKELSFLIFCLCKLIWDSIGIYWILVIALVEDAVCICLTDYLVRNI